MSVGIPIKALHEAEGHIVTLETLTGEIYRGKLLIAEDNMNCQMAQVTVTHRDGRMTQLENVFVRGSKVRFFIFPDMIKNAPFFRQKDKSKVGIVGKSAFLKAQASKAQGRGIGKAKQYLERARQGR